MKIILGIDPGLVNTGWSVIAEVQNQVNIYKHLSSGTIKTNSSDMLDDRLYLIYSELSKVIKLFSPNFTVIEMSYVNTNPNTSLKLSNAIGAIMLTLRMFGLKVNTYSPSEIKKSIVGNGRADKDKVAYILKHSIKNLNNNNFHEYDATAVAFCCGLRI